MLLTGGLVNFYSGPISVDPVCPQPTRSCVIEVDVEMEGETESEMEIEILRWV